MVKNKKSLIERTQARLASRKVEGEQGSLILDILIGMAIFALIAIIAVSAISQYRERAYAQTVTSDIKALALAMEADYTDTQVYPSPTDPAARARMGVTLSKGVNVQGFSVNPATQTFTLCLVHRSSGQVDAQVNYNSATGGVVGPAKRGSEASDMCTL